MNIQQLQTKFEAYLLTEQRVAINTFNSYKRDLNQFFAYLNKENSDVTITTSDDLKRYIHYLYGLKLSSRSIARKISALKSFFAYIHINFNIKNSAKELCFPKIEKKLPTYLSEEEIKRVLEQAKKDNSSLSARNTIMLYLLYVSGMRVSELISLCVSDFHFDTGFISLVGKGGRQRMIPLPSAMVHILNEYIQSMQNSMVLKRKLADRSLYLFPVLYGKKIKPISRQSCWMILKKLCINAGIKRPVSPHQLRHSFATHMLKKGADLRSLQLLLGHENISTVQTYTHVETSHLRIIYDKKHPRS